MAMVELLLSRGADPHRRTQGLHFHNALMERAYRCSFNGSDEALDVIEALMRHGLDPREGNRDGTSALDLGAAGLRSRPGVN
jgi:hypothetical protein